MQKAYFSLRTAILVVLAGCIAWGSQPSGWVPVVAKVRKVVYKVDANGAKEVAREEQGPFYRSSSGATFSRTQLIKDGKPVGQGVATLTDPEAATSYIIDYDSRTIRPVQKLRQPYRPAVRNQQSTQVGRERMVNGVFCHALPVKQNGVKTAGTQWISFEYDLPVKMETEIRTKSGTLNYFVYELYDIQTNVEPDPSVFSKPQGFRLLAIPSAACPTCMQK